MRVLRTSIVLVALVLVVAGCGDDGTDTVRSERSAPPATPEETAFATVSIAATDLGEVLVDGEGYVLYLFTEDEPARSTCTGSCAETWPPLEAPPEVRAGEGVDAGLLGSITRDDGTEQVTYDSHPLYRYAGDPAPGDTNGQGVGGVWFAVGPDGEAVEATPPTGPGY